MRRWASGDERTLGVFLGVGVLTMAFLRLDKLRGAFGVVPEAPLVLTVVITALAWWSLLPRSFVWLDPAVLTWRDYGGINRVAIVAGRLVGGWLGRLLALGYVLAVLSALVRAPVATTVAGVAVLVGAGFLALAVVRRPRAEPWHEALAVLTLAVVGLTRPGPVVSFVLAGVLAVAGLVLFRPGTPPVADATRQTLVDGWRDRVLRVSGVQFLDLALLLPAARPVRPRPLTSGLRLAWQGVLGRARHAPTAALLGLTAAAVHRMLPALPDVVVFTVLGYLALVPLGAGLGELWRSPGRRRWVGSTDTALRWHHFLVTTTVAAAWGLPVWLLSGSAPAVLLTVPVLSACAVRTMTRKPPTYDNLVPVDTPFGAVPTRLILQTTRGPDAGVLAVLLVSALPVWGAALVVVAVVVLAVFR
ncbi:hypothetical protein CLV71_101552 [Actinophytocola oryzae]|uniref:Uncharacterized protein n=2 Tax=Actinophytocola oryzae TaxID=502181 RepID=A0A4R7W6L9_9PSEU|nr:hypothetical protein CLV71_101552 [Actinophytocola oryzae]